jgi:hypothetical protein
MSVILFGIGVVGIGTLFLIYLVCDFSSYTKPNIKYVTKFGAERPYHQSYDNEEETINDKVVTLIPSDLAGHPYKYRRYKLVLKGKESGIKATTYHSGIDAISTCREFNSMFNKDKTFDIVSIKEKD